jgi:iron complex transport system substrate-binding protein
LRIYFFILLFFSLINYSCKNNTQEHSNYFAIKDDLNNEISFTETPKKIISLAPNITETIYSIEADSLLAGVTNYCDYPPEAKSKIKIGGMIDPDIEVIMSVNPDLILLTVEGNSKNTYQSLTNLGFKVFAFNPRNFDGICKMIDDLGRITNKLNNSQNVIKKLISNRDSIKAITNTLTIKTCFIIISIIPLITVNKTTFVNEIAEFAGFKNIYADENNPYPEISFEDLILKKPDYFIFPANLNNKNFIKNATNLLKEKLLLSDIMIDNKLIFIDENAFMRPGPRFFNSVFEILNKIH